MNHGRDEWELTTLERDMDPEMFRMMVSQLDPAMLQQFGGAQLPDIDADTGSAVEFDPVSDDTGFESPATEGIGVPDIDGMDIPEGPPLRDLVDEETQKELDAQLQAIMDDRIDSLDQQEIEHEFPMMLDPESEDRFLDLYAHLLVYVNDRFDVLGNVETVADISERDTGELLPLRERLYEKDTAEIIEAFVDENPAELSENDIETVAGWTDYEYGEFVVVRHLSDYAVFLDWDDPPRAFGVKAVRMSFSDLWPEERLPVFVSSVALLPFEGRVVTDGWLAIQRVVAGGNLSTDIDDSYEEAKHRFGIIETLPIPDESEKSDAEQLRYSIL